MSQLAIGSVTKALIELLSSKLNKPALMGPGIFPVTSLPPDDDRVGAETSVNLYLYRVTESPFLKNMPWGGDRSHPNGSTRPPLALTLNYILTGYAKKVVGSEQEDVTAHQLLGNAMSILHDYPVLNDVHDSDFDADQDAQFAAELRDSFDKIKVSLLPISVDELSKIWTGFSKGYRLSVAYEVSLVQIAPVVPTELAAPPPSRRSVRAAPAGPPAITSIDPTGGPVGSQVRLTGSNLTGPGGPTVTIGTVPIAGGDLEAVSDSAITVTVPADVSGGPNVPVTVTRGGLTSAPVTFRVAPWIASLQPVRGITGVPITIPFPVPSGATASVTIGGIAAATTVDAANQMVSAVVPLTIATNGPVPVVLKVDGGTARQSNALLYEVLPSIITATLANSGTPATSTLTVTGERLRGSDVVVRYDKLQARVGDVTDPLKFPDADTTIAFAFDRVLPAGGSVSLTVDGRQTNPLPRTLTAVEPAQAAGGDTVTLTGSGLAGRSVVVSFGATALPAVAQPFATRFAVQVPAGLAAGATTVKVVVDESDAGSLPFQVLG